MSKSLLCCVAVAVACLSWAATTAAACDGTCPPFQLDWIPNQNVNSTWHNNITIHKHDGMATTTDTAKCLNTTRDYPGGPWSTKCSWSINCSSVNGSVVFRELYVQLVNGSTIQIANFSIWNKNILATPLITLGGLYITRTGAGPRDYSYAPDSLVTGNSTHNADISLTISSAVPAPDPDYEVNVYMNFTCSRIYRYIYVPYADELPDDGGFWSMFAAYILPSIIVLIIIIIALIRYCNPDLTMKLKKWAGFKELDEEGRLRHTKIKDRAGGGTWHDHAAEVVSDLRREKVEQLEARMETANVEDEELDEFAPAKVPAAPAREGVSGDSIDLDDDDDDNGAKARVAPPKRTVKSSDDDLNFDSDDDDDEDEESDESSDLDLDDDIL